MQKKKIRAQNNVEFTKNILFGNPGNSIVTFAENKKNGIEIIVMGSRGYGHANGFTWVWSC